MEDTLLCSRHVYADKYTAILKDKFKTKKKYKFKTNAADYNNGDIEIYDEPPKGGHETYGFTIHSFQGETIKSPHVNHLMFSILTS